jgi:hypothetical protein
MLRVNTSLVLKLPPDEYAGADERLCGSRKQMRSIDQRLNQVGRARLVASRQTTREEYIDALHELNSYASSITTSRERHFDNGLDQRREKTQDCVVKHLVNDPASGFCAQANFASAACGDNE